MARARSRWLGAVVAIVGTFLFGALARAATIHVPDDEPSIVDGIAAAVAGDTVLVACGTYFERNIAMKSGVTLRSASGEPDCVTLDGQLTSRLILCADVDNTTRIEGLTLTRGAELGDGEQGGAMLCLAASPTIVNCSFLDNAADDWGGGVYCTDGSSPSFTNCTFTANSANDSGGAIGLLTSSAAFVECVFSINSAANGGGAMAAWEGSATFVGCVFVGNRARVGGGGAFFCALDVDLTFDHCTFSGNFWGSIVLRDFFSRPCTATLNNTIIAFGPSGPPISCTGNSSATLQCSNIYGNRNGDWVDCIEGQQNITDNFSADPLFCDANAGDVTLAANSPCLSGNHPDAANCGVIGAFGASCPALPIEQDSWGAIKAMYR